MKMSTGDTIEYNEDQTEFQEQCLAAHNAIRNEHGCPPLKWSPDLAEHARIWADKLAERGRVLYSEMPGVGENIAVFSTNDFQSDTPSNDQPDYPDHLPILNQSSEIDPDHIVSHWAKERDLYDFVRGGWQRRAHNFTQMIWKSSTELGVAKSMSKDGKKIFVVALYKPAGNINKEGDFAKNVPKMTNPPV